MIFLNENPCSVTPKLAGRTVLVFRSVVFVKMCEPLYETDAFTGVCGVFTVLDSVFGKRKKA